MTPLDVSDGIATYLMDELRKLNETSDVTTSPIRVLVTTYDEALTKGHVGLYHLLEVVRERLLSDNPVALKYEIKENTVNTTIPDDQPYPQWVGYLEFEVYIPVIRRNLNKIFTDNKVIE